MQNMCYIRNFWGSWEIKRQKTKNVNITKEQFVEKIDSPFPYESQITSLARSKNRIKGIFKKETPVSGVY